MLIKKTDLQLSDQQKLSLWLPEKTNRFRGLQFHVAQDTNQSILWTAYEKAPSEAPAASLLPLLKRDSSGSLSLDTRVAPSAATAHGEFIMALTARRIVTLNEIVEQYVRPDPLREAVEVCAPAAAAGKS